jgi:hypothetical protein
VLQVNRSAALFVPLARLCHAMTVISLSPREIVQQMMSFFTKLLHVCLFFHIFASQLGCNVNNQKNNLYEFHFIGREPCHFLSWAHQI